MTAYLASIIVTSLIRLAPPLIIRDVIDVALPDGDTQKLNLLLLLMLVLILTGALLGVLQTFLSNVVSQNLMFDLRRRLYEHISGMSMRWFTSNRTGDVQSRISNDVGGIQSVMSDTFGSFLSNFITLVSTLALMLFLDWRLALFSIAFVPLLILPARRIGNIQRNLQRQTQEQMATMTAHMQETLSVDGALLVKTFGRKPEEMSRFNGTADLVRGLSVKRAMTGRGFWMILGLVSSLGPAVVYWYGGHRIIGGEATLGTVVALATLLPQLFQPATSLLNLHVNVLSSLALFERIFDYLDLEQEIKDKPRAVDLEEVRGEIEFRNVDFEYLQGQPVLRDVSFTIEPGQFVALVGATGAGKTTVVSLVARLYDVTGGSVRIDGVDVRDATLASLADNIGMVEQEPYLFHTSIRANLAYAKPDATDAEIIAAAKAANIDDFISRLPEGYETVVGEKGYRLSGGEKQRIAIARALLKDPSVLILDEATSNIDAMTEASIQQAIETVSRGRTVVAIAHRLSTILAADMILVMDGGRVVESGRHEELVLQGGYYARLYERQFRGGRLALPD
jgi:ATP-binding cassette subfamily B protein